MKPKAKPPAPQFPPSMNLSPATVAFLWTHQEMGDAAFPVGPYLSWVPGSNRWH